MSGTDGKLPLEEIVSLKTCSILAVLIPVVFAILWITSATLDGEWTFGTDSLSRMGISDNPVSAALFNYGCMVTGALGFILGYATAVHEKGYNTYCGAAYSAGMVFLMVVGIFPMDQGIIHYIAAGVFGIFMFIALIFSALTDYYQRWHPEVDLIILAAALILIATQIFEMWEPLLVIFVMVWTVIHGIKMRMFADQFPLSIKNEVD